MLPQYTTDDVSRFWSKVDRSGDCWLWTAGKIRQGYGRFRVDGKGYLSHRFVYILTHGTLSDDICVLHSCDNPSCVRPDHLFLGTKTDNAADRDKKGRASGGKLVGETNGSARLTADQVREIRYRHTIGESTPVIAVRFCISRGHVNDIVRHKKWKHIN